MEDDELPFRPVEPGWRVQLQGSGKDSNGWLTISKSQLIFRDATNFGIKSIELATISAFKKDKNGCCTIKYEDNSETCIAFEDPEQTRPFAEALGEALSRVSSSPPSENSMSSSSPSPPPPESVASDAVISDHPLRSGVKRVVFPSIGFVSFSSVEVTSPLTVSPAAADSSSYVVYAVRSKVQILHQSHPHLWIVYHRYSDFEALDQKLRTLIAEHLEGAIISLPVFPPKPWIPAGQQGRDFVESRARKLHRYLSAVMANEELTKRVHYLEPLLQFVSDGEMWQEASGVLGVSFLEKGIYGVNSAFSKLLDSRDPPTPEQDYTYVKDLYTKQGLVASRVAWKKLVISIFGTTSSGKSSFVSHLFTVACAASSMAGQVDTGFSIVEAVPEAEFMRYSQEKSFPNYTVQQLKEPLLPSAQNLRGDKRYGFVFVYLDVEETLERYREQLAEGQSVLSRYNKIRTVLVNARYLNGSKEDVDLASRIILIDSKGIDATTLKGGDESVWSEVKASQFIAKISNLNLFMMPAHDIRNCEPAISVFELTIVCSEEGIEFMKKQRLLERKSGEGSSGSGGSGGGGGAGGGGGGVGGSTGIVSYSQDPLSGLFYRLLGLDGVVGAVRNAGMSLVNYLLPPSSKQLIDVGTARWQKTFFILSRADQVLRADPRAEQQLFFEMGVAFGRRLNYLEAPTFARIALLGLPEKQSGDQKPVTGFLNDFKTYLMRQSLDSSYDHSRDDALIAMCDELEREMNSGWVSSAYFKIQGPYIRSAKRRALSRRFSVGATKVAAAPK